MKYPLKRPFAAMLIACGAPAFAQSTVTIYGIVDTAVAYIGKTGGAGFTIKKLTANGSTPSRIGFRGTEDLGGGYRANFVLETGFAPDTGTLSQGGRSFGRQSTIGLETPYGEVVLGRQYTFRYALYGSDYMGDNLFGVGSVDPYIPNDRADNSIGYRFTYGKFNYRAVYSFGRDVAATGGPAATNCAGESASDRKACTQLSMLGTYDGDGWGVAAAYDKLRGGPGIRFEDLNSSKYYDLRTTLNGYVSVFKGRIGVGWIGRKHESAAPYRQSIGWVSLTQEIAPLVHLDATLYRINRRHSRDDAWFPVARLRYLLSARTNLYATAGYMDNQGASALSVDGQSPSLAGKKQFGVALGIRHNF